METQNQIKRRLSKPEAIEHIRNLLDTHDDIRRTELADKLCEQFGFLDPRGNKQRSGCLKALCELGKADFFVLPQYVVNMSRFLIRSGVSCRNLGESRTAWTRL